MAWGDLSQNAKFAAGCLGYTEQSFRVRCLVHFTPLQCGTWGWLLKIRCLTQPKDYDMSGGTTDGSPKHVNDSVEVNWHKGSGKWYGGTVTAQHEDGTYRIQYVDGEIEDNVIRAHIRQMPRRRAAGAPHAHSDTQTHARADQQHAQHTCRLIRLSLRRRRGCQGPFAGHAESGGFAEESSCLPESSFAIQTGSGS